MAPYHSGLSLSILSEDSLGVFEYLGLITPGFGFEGSTININLPNSRIVAHYGTETSRGQSEQVSW